MRLHLIIRIFLSLDCSDSDNDDKDEFATRFIYNNGNNAPTDNITAGVAA